MLAGMEYKRMTPEEVRELMTLKGWSQTQLGAALDISESAVSRWLHANRVPRGPASVLMRIWLEDAKGRRTRKDRQPVAG